MKMRGSNYTLLACILTLVIFTGTTLSQLSQRDLLVHMKAKILDATAEKVESLNDTCRQSNHYYYTQTVCVSDAPVENIIEQLIDPIRKPVNQQESILAPDFKLEYFGSVYDNITVSVAGTLLMPRLEKITQMVRITALRSHLKYQEFETKSTDKFLALRLTGLTNNSNGKQHEVKIILTVYPHGVTSIYYENIPSEINSTDLESSMSVHDVISGKSEEFGTIRVPQSMIKTHTLVYFRPTQKYCSKELSMEACSNASTPGVRCYWCEEIQKCSNGFDIHTEAWIQHKCNNTLMLEDVKMYLKTKENNTSLYLSIFLPIGFLLLILSIAFAIWYWKWRGNY